jgi:predicted nucleic acid-binding protein
LSFIVVLDACVLIPAALRDTLLRTAHIGLYRAQWSEHILDEMQRNLVEHGMTTEAGAEQLRVRLQDAFAAALVPRESYETLIPVMRNDPKDRHVLAAAVACGAQVIVTMNLRDFPGEALNVHRIEAQHPDQFLEHLYHVNPEALHHVVTAQAAALLAPPLTVSQVLEVLALTAPRFAALVREHLAPG